MTHPIDSVIVAVVSFEYGLAVGLLFMGFALTKKYTGRWLP